MIRAGNETTLRDAPTDGISAVKFGPCSDTVLLSSSWDSSVYLHDAVENRLVTKWTLDSPVLDCCLSSEPTLAYAGTLDHAVMQLHIGSSSSRQLGRHSDSVKCVSHCRSTGLVMSGSWDRTLAFWDHRQTDALLTRIELPGKAYSMDISQNLLVLAMSDRHIWLFDTRNLAAPLQKRESSLKYATRCVRAFPSGEGYVCTSIEGRVAVDFVDASEEAQAQKYAFKCHRAVVQGDEEAKERVFPVNAAAFHPTYGTFATGGSDEVVSFWDRVNRKRIRQLPKYTSSIASLSFNRDGQLLAVASSYGFEEGERESPASSIHIRAVEDTEIKPKSIH